MKVRARCAAGLRLALRQPLRRVSAHTARLVLPHPGPSRPEHCPSQVSPRCGAGFAARPHANLAGLHPTPSSKFPGLDVLVRQALLSHTQPRLDLLGRTCGSLPACFSDATLNSGGLAEGRRLGIGRSVRGAWPVLPLAMLPTFRVCWTLEFCNRARNTLKVQGTCVEVGLKCVAGPSVRLALHQFFAFSRHIESRLVWFAKRRTCQGHVGAPLNIGSRSVAGLVARPCQTKRRANQVRKRRSPIWSAVCVACFAARHPPTTWSNLDSKS